MMTKTDLLLLLLLLFFLAFSVLVRTSIISFVNCPLFDKINPRYLQIYLKPQKTYTIYKCRKNTTDKFHSDV